MKKKKERNTFETYQIHSVTYDKRSSYRHSPSLPPAMIYIGPIHIASPAAFEQDKLKTEEDENANILPIATQLIVGKSSHDGIDASLDFCTSGREIIFSNILMTRNNFLFDVENKCRTHESGYRA